MLARLLHGLLKVAEDVGDNGAGGCECVAWLFRHSLRAAHFGLSCSRQLRSSSGSSDHMLATAREFYWQGPRTVSEAGVGLALSSLHSFTLNTELMFWLAWRALNRL